LLPLRDKLKSTTRPWVVYIIFVLCLLVFLYQLTLGEELILFFQSYGVVPFLLELDIAWEQRGVFFQLLPFFSSMFLHGSWMHIIGNLWTLWIFGDNVQDRMGPLRFTIFYAMAGIVSMAMHTLTNWGSLMPAIGASGAIAGVMGAYLIYFPRARVVTLLPLIFYFTIIEVPAFVFLIIWFGLQFFNGAFALMSEGAVSGIAWWAHVGGFVFGLVTARLFEKNIFPPVDVNILAQREKQ
jgi:membrane associated rhomboid family serine protease